MTIKSIKVSKHHWSDISDAYYFSFVLDQRLSWLQTLPTDWSKVIWPVNVFFVFSPSFLNLNVRWSKSSMSSSSLWLWKILDLRKFCWEDRLRLRLIDVYAWIYPNYELPSGMFLAASHYPSESEILQSCCKPTSNIDFTSFSTL